MHGATDVNNVYVNVCNVVKIELTHLVTCMINSVRTLLKLLKRF